MEVFVVLSLDCGFNPEVEGVFRIREEAENYRDFLADENKEFYIKSSFLDLE